MGVTTDKKNKPLNPRGNDQSPLAYNRAKLFSGKALDFDGVNDVITIHEATDLWTGDFSVSWYGNLDAVGNYFAFSSGIFHGSAQAGINIWYGGGNALNFSVHFPESDGTGQQGYDLTLAESYEYWHRIDLIFVSSSRLLSLYQNGILVDTATIASNVDAAYMPNGWEFGRSYGGSYPLDGKLTNLKAFNTALTAAQVADLYNNPEKVVPTGVDNTALKLWLPMMEGAGTTAYDGSGNGNHGTISGATYVHGIGAPVSQTAVIDWNKGTNLLTYSEQFDNGYWSKNTFQISLTANAANAPDGQTTADKITNISTGSNPVVFSSAISITATTDYVVSVYAKSAGKDWICVRDITDSNPRVWFNLSNGTIGTEITATGTIESVGNGWYRCSVYNNGSSSTTGRAVFLSVDADNSLTGTSSGTDGIYIWGASVEQSATAGPYIPTIATAQTSEVLLPQGLTTGRDITGVNLFENVRKQGALNLDGNSWAEVHDNASLDITDAITLEAWYYNDGVNATKIIQGRWSNQVDMSYLMYLNNSNLIFVGHSGSAVFGGNESTTSLASNQYSHVAITYDRSYLKYYINGSLVDTFTFTVSLNPNATVALDIGRNDARSGVYTGSNYNDTPIAQPRIYNRALTAAEVQKNYNAGKNIYTN